MHHHPIFTDGVVMQAFDLEVVDFDLVVIDTNTCNRDGTLRREQEIPSPQVTCFDVGAFLGRVEDDGGAGAELFGLGEAEGVFGGGFEGGAAGQGDFGEFAVVLVDEDLGDAGLDEGLLGVVPSGEQLIFVVLVHAFAAGEGVAGEAAGGDPAVAGEAAGDGAAVDGFGEAAGVEGFASAGEAFGAEGACFGGSGGESGCAGPGAEGNHADEGEGGVAGAVVGFAGGEVVADAAPGFGTAGSGADDDPAGGAGEVEGGCDDGHLGLGVEAIDGFFIERQAELSGAQAVERQAELGMVERTVGREEVIVLDAGHAAEGEVGAGNQPAGSRRSQVANGRVCGLRKKDCEEGKELKQESGHAGV